VADINRLIGTLQNVAADAETRGPVVALVRDTGELDVRVPPARVLNSPRAFFCMIRAGLREADASAVGLLLPVRTVWDEEQVCDYLDAEAFALVAAENFGDRVASVGVRCALHALPSGWAEAHDRLQVIAAPLRQAMVDWAVPDSEVT
jgi:hypothetical protein